MIREDAVKILYRMSAAWPNQRLEDPTIEVWVEHLSLLSAVVAADAVRELEISSKWFPTIAEFRAAYDRAADAHRNARAQDRGLPTPVERSVAPERAKELIGELRAKIDISKQDGKVPHP